MPTMKFMVNNAMCQDLGLPCTALTSETLGVLVTVRYCEEIPQAKELLEKIALNRELAHSSEGESIIIRGSR